MSGEGRDAAEPDPNHYLRAIPHANGVVHYRRGNHGYGPKLCEYMDSWKPLTPGGEYRDVRGFPTCLWCMKWRLRLCRILSSP